MVKGGKGKHRGGKALNGNESQEEVNGYAASYIQKFVKCNKERCKKCKASGGRGHGPYWYKIYRTKSGKVRTKYHGRVPPELVDENLIDADVEEEKEGEDQD